ncbi:MAG: penicillin acylase family protein [Aureispira sp.]
MHQFYSLPLFLLFLLPWAGKAQAPNAIDVQNINIVRDAWGVPHIFTKTDIEAAYGLAWAHSEDNFEQVQQPMLVARGWLGTVLGKDGALFDAVAYLLDARTIAEERYEAAFSPAFKRILEAYAAGLNRFAELHPEEVLHPELFPVTPIDITTAYIISTAVISNIQHDLGRIFGNTLGPITKPNEKSLTEGSNGIALAPSKTKEGKTFLLSNSHQPLRSYLSWYEVHIHTEEGWNFIGATFCGGVTPFVGTNEHLGWTHCVNFNNYHDVYQLVMHPTNKLQYRLDGQWYTLEERIWKSKVNLGWLTLPVQRKFYRSKFGPVIKNKSGYYALRIPATSVVGAAEQWYHMNKATSLTEFKEAMRRQQHPSLSTTYADKEGNIFFLDNGLFPDRNPAYNWDCILPGDTSATLWAEEFAPLEELLQVENPPSGYVYHMNGSGFNSTGPEDNPTPAEVQVIGYFQEETARHLHFQDLMEGYDLLSYDDFKAIKYNTTLRFPLYTRTIANWDMIRHLSPELHPDLADIIAVFSKWDGNAAVDNKQAAIFALSTKYIFDRMRKEGRWDISGPLPLDYFPAALRYAKKHLKRNFKSLEIELGQLQNHVRGDKVYPVGGVPESIAAMYLSKWKGQKLQTDLGDSYIMFMTYGKEGVEKIETINCYGASNRPESPHYNDQMEVYVAQKTKTMTLDKASILKNAKRQYHPK